jgi:enoyl-CoA hydratase/carnithine racemase
MVEPVTVSIDGRGVAVVSIDNPPINLMTVGVFVGMARTVERLACNDDVRVVVIRSANPEWFIAHFDVEAILQFPLDQPEPGELNAFHVMCETLRTMAKPTIAQIEGRVGGGGCELAASCDMRFATPDAVFSQPEVALGIIPGGSGTVRLPRLIGRSRALEAILGCDDIDAATAERWGWVNRVLPRERIAEFVDELAARIASFPSSAVAEAKASVLRADGDLRAALLAEAGAFNRTLSDDSAQRAMRRFIELGGQTPDGERRLADLVAELSDELS